MAQNEYHPYYDLMYLNPNGRLTNCFSAHWDSVPVAVHKIAGYYIDANLIFGEV